MSYARPFQAPFGKAVCCPPPFFFFSEPGKTIFPSHFPLSPPVWTVPVSNYFLLEAQVLASQLLPQFTSAFSLTGTTRLQSHQSISQSRRHRRCEVCGGSGWRAQIPDGPGMTQTKQDLLVFFFPPLQTISFKNSSDLAGGFVSFYFFCGAFGKVAGPPKTLPHLFFSSIYH